LGVGGLQRKASGASRTPNDKWGEHMNRPGRASGAPSKRKKKKKVKKRRLWNCRNVIQLISNDGSGQRDDAK